MATDQPKLHPEAQLMVDYLEKQGKDRYAGESIDDIRKNHSLSSQSVNGTVDFKGKTTDIRIPSPDVSDGIPARVYVPDSIPADPTIWVYFHGGGMVLGGILSCEAACQIISMSAAVIVVNVEYRLAPEFKCPAQMDDGICAAKWVLENKTSIGGSANSLVGIGGDSAGGTISASVAHDVPGLDYQVLIYPHCVRGEEFHIESRIKYKDGPLLTAKLSKWFEEKYLIPGDERNPRMASVLRDRFDHLPPALIVAAEIDPLRDEAEVYQKKLLDAGVPCEIFEVKGVLHAFFTQPGLYKTTAKLAYDKVTEFLKGLKK